MNFTYSGHGDGGGRGEKKKERRRLPCMEGVDVLTSLT